MRILFFLLITIQTCAQVKNWYQSQPDSKFGLLTEKTINEFRNVSHELFTSLDTLKIPVYVKVMDEREMNPVASGLTNIQKDCIFIRIAASPRATRTLAHEFGHAIYQITHPEYTFFYANRYNADYKRSTKGHDGDDESGKMAFYFEDQHVKNVRGANHNGAPL
jgi:hypothetical protein